MKWGKRMYFAVIREPGASWLDGVALQRQPLSDEHAAVMSGLSQQGLVQVGGPLGDGGRDLLICRAQTGAEIRRQFEGDPWVMRDMLRIRAIHTFEILLGADSPTDVGWEEKGYFAVVSEQGPAWVPGVAMREQALWTDHARFMNGTAEDGFVLVGGPLGGTGEMHRALLIVQAGSEEQVRARLGQDPWTSRGILRIAALHAWTVLLAAPVA